MKKIFSSVTVLLIAIVLVSCNKEDQHAKKLYKNQGRWTIDYVTTQLFDSTGAVISDSTVKNIGELVLFKSGSLDALYGYRQAVFLYTDSVTHAYPFEYMFDGKRISIKYCDAPFEIDGTYSAFIDKANEQQWEIYSTNGNTNAVTSLTGKYIMHLSRSEN